VTASCVTQQMHPKRVDIARVAAVIGITTAIRAF
jgi:hypothetical protein